jgi:hypothetical protein
MKAERRGGAVSRTAFGSSEGSFQLRGAGPEYALLALICNTGASAWGRLLSAEIKGEWGLRRKNAGDEAGRGPVSRKFLVTESAQRQS